MSDKPFKMNTQHIYARDASQDYLKTTPFGADLGSWAFAKNLAEESERNKLHDAKSLLEAAISKDVVKYIDKTFPSIEKAGELGSHSAVKMVGGAVGKFSKVDDFFKMAQHVEQGHGREFAIEGAGLACAPAGGVAGAVAGAKLGVLTGPWGAILGAGAGAFGGSELCKGLMEYATDHRENLFYTAGKMPPTMTRQNENFFGEFTEEYALVNYNWYRPEPTTQTAIINRSVEQVYAYRLVRDDELTKQLNQTALNATGYPKVIAYLEELAAQSQKIEDKQREVSNQQQFRQSEREDAHNAELGKRMDARIATGPKWIPADGTPSPKGLSPNGMPLGENCSQMVFMGGNRFDKINGWAVKQADGSIIESQWKLDAQNKLEYRQTDLLDRNGVRQKTVSYFHDSETQQNTAKVLIFKDGKNVEYTANYTEIAHNKWELTSVFNSKSQPLDDDNKKKFEKDHPNDKMMNTSSLKQAGLDPMDQLPENVRRTAQSLENHHRDKLAEKGLSPEEIQNACVALACNMGQYPGRQPKEILTTYLNQNGEIRVVTQERYAPSVVIETAKTQTFEQSVATMDQALEQQQQAMQQRQNQSQGGPVLSMGGHRMV